MDQEVQTGWDWKKNTNIYISVISFPMNSKDAFELGKYINLQ